MNNPAAWHGKPYYSLDAYCKNTFQHKCYKIALNAHLTCPNRDGTLDVRGCVFCSKGGSGDFAISLPEYVPGESDSSQSSFLEGKDGVCSYGDTPLGGTDVACSHGDASLDGTDTACSHGDISLDMTRQLEQGLALFREKAVGVHFIAYFQAYTNTYGPVDYLAKIYRSALRHPKVCGISIATRPDCLGDDILLLLADLKEEFPEKFIWVELGLQTMHADTAKWMRRGYELPVFEKAFTDLSRLGLPVVVHVILGLPGEDEARTLQTMDYLNRIRPFGVKLQLLHVLKDTDLATQYLDGKIKVLTKEEYLSLLTACIARLRPDIVLHRVTGDGAGKDLIAPDWSRNKKDVLNSLHRKMKLENVMQGNAFDPAIK